MSALAGAGTLTRLALRQDRARIPLWVGAVGGLVIANAASLPAVYETAQERQARAALMANPSAMAITGPGHGRDDYTFGAMVANELLGFAAIAVALMSVFLVARHTRAEEESGRAELVRAAVVGRFAAPAAALVVAVGVNLLLGAVVAVGLAASPSELSVEGSALFGASLAAVGIAFAAVAAVTSQMTEHTRGATGMASAALGLAFVLRAAGDVGGGGLSWLSPIGWAQATRVFVDDRWWPLLLAVGFAAVVVAVALALITRRDVGAGLTRPRPGPREASDALARPVGLAVRLHRGTLIGWAVGVLLIALAYGTLVQEADNFVAENPQLQDFLVQAEGATLSDAFLATVLVFVALLTAGFATQATLRMRAEESAGRAEPILATATPRWRWAASHLTVALAGSVVIAAVGGLGLALSYGATSGEWDALPGIVGGALAHVPAVWVVASLAAALFGLAPRLVGAAWVVLAYAVLVEMLGGLLQFPAWMSDLSPLGHTPQLPAADLAAGPLMALLALAAALVAIALAAFSRRGLSQPA